MSKSIETTVAQNINATLTVEDIPMNENVTLAQLNAEAEAKAEAKAEKKEKYSVTRELKARGVFSEIEEKKKGNDAAIKKLQNVVLPALLGAGIDTAETLAKIDVLRNNPPQAPTDGDFLRWGKILWEVIK